MSRIPNKPVGSVKFERPVSGKLMLQLYNGDSWEAQPAELLKFGYVSAEHVYDRLCTWIREVTGIVDLTENAHLNAIRYAVECALMYDHMPDEETVYEFRVIAGVKP